MAVPVHQSLIRKRVEKHRLSHSAKPGQNHVVQNHVLFKQAQEFLAFLLPSGQPPWCIIMTHLHQPRTDTPRIPDPSASAKSPGRRKEKSVPMPNQSQDIEDGFQAVPGILVPLMPAA